VIGIAVAVGSEKVVMGIARLTKDRISPEHRDDESAQLRGRAAQLLKPMDYTESIPTNPLREKRRSPLRALLFWLTGPSSTS
jgi:hypothetical protein